MNFHPPFFIKNKKKQKNNQKELFVLKFVVFLHPQTENGSVVQFG